MVVVGERYALRTSVLGGELLVEVEVRQLDPVVDGNPPSSATVIVVVPDPVAEVVGRCVRVTVSELATVPEPFPASGISLGEVVVTDSELEMASAHTPCTSPSTGPPLLPTSQWNGPTVTPEKTGTTPGQASNVEPLQLVMTQMAVMHGQQQEMFAWYQKMKAKASSATSGHPGSSPHAGALAGLNQMLGMYGGGNPPHHVEPLPPLQPAAELEAEDEEERSSVGEGPWPRATHAQVAGMAQGFSVSGAPHGDWQPPLGFSMPMAGQQAQWGRSPEPIAAASMGAGAASSAQLGWPQEGLVGPAGRGRTPTPAHVHWPQGMAPQTRPLTEPQSPVPGVHPWAPQMSGAAASQSPWIPGESAGSHAPAAAPIGGTTGSSPFLQELWGTEAATPKVPTTDLEMQLEILRTLRSLQRGRTDAEDEECDVEGGGGLMGLTRASEWGASGPGEHRKPVGIRRLRRKWRFRPFAMIREYPITVRDRRGSAHESLPWHMRQYSAAVRAQFGRCLGRWRVHHEIHETLDLLCLRDDTRHAVALLVQPGKATHQAALDGGS